MSGVHESLVQQHLNPDFETRAFELLYCRVGKHPEIPGTQGILLQAHQVLSEFGLLTPKSAAEIEDAIYLIPIRQVTKPEYYFGVDTIIARGVGTALRLFQEHLSFNQLSDISPR